MHIDLILISTIAHTVTKNAPALKSYMYSNQYQPIVDAINNKSCYDWLILITAIANVIVFGILTWRLYKLNKKQTKILQIQALHPLINALNELKKLTTSWPTDILLSCIKSNEKNCLKKKCDDIEKLFENANTNCPNLLPDKIAFRINYSYKFNISIIKVLLLQIKDLNILISWDQIKTGQPNLDDLFIESFNEYPEIIKGFEMAKNNKNMIDKLINQIKKI